MILIDKMSYEEAIEFIDYNTIRALPYVENSPIVVHGIDIYESTTDESNFRLDSDEKVKYITKKCINWIREWFDRNGKWCNAV